MADFPILYLPLCATYFDQIAAGKKPEEFRLTTPYWAKRLAGREYSKIILTKGYPKRDDTTRRMICAWRGCVKKAIVHPHFGNKSVTVFAIDVSEIVIPPIATTNTSEAS